MVKIKPTSSEEQIRNYLKGDQTEALQIAKDTEEKIHKFGTELIKKAKETTPPKAESSFTERDFNQRLEISFIESLLKEFFNSQGFIVESQQSYNDLSIKVCHITIKQKA